MKDTKKVLIVILAISLIAVIAVLIKTKSVNAHAQDVANLQGQTQVEGLGDVNENDDGTLGDGLVDARDAAVILKVAAEIGSGSYKEIYSQQKDRSDVNGDGSVDCIDAKIVLVYSAKLGAGTTGKSFQDFVASEEYKK